MVLEWELMDMLLAKKRAKDRRGWLKQRGDLGDVLAETEFE